MFIGLIYLLKFFKIKQSDEFKENYGLVKHNNPDATFYTTLTIYDDHTLEKIYSGLNFFWGMGNEDSNATHYISFKFTKPILLHK